MNSINYICVGNRMKIPFLSALIASKIFLRENAKSIHVGYPIYKIISSLWY
jgi:hypothetical protein